MAGEARRRETNSPGGRREKKEKRKEKKKETKETSLHASKYPRRWLYLWSNCGQMTASQYGRVDLKKKKKVREMGTVDDEQKTTNGKRREERKSCRSPLPPKSGYEFREKRVRG